MVMMGKHSILVISLDGATFDLLNPLMDAGCMPVLSSLVKDGIAGTLESSIPPVSAPAWASFQTGVNPGKHGIVDFFRYQAGSYKPSLVSSESIQAPTLWSLLSKQGRRLCVLNVPVTYPPQPVDGCMIAGFLTPGLDVDFTYPAELRKQLLSSVPEYVIAPSMDIAVYGISGFVKKMIHTIWQRWKAACWLMDLESWDLFMVQFQATDTLQHALWDCLDSTQPGFATYTSEERRLVRQFYHTLDEIIGDLIGRAGDASIIIMSDHGFGPARKRVYINRWLAAQEYLALNVGNAWMSIQAGVEDLIKRLDVLGARHRLLPRGVQSVRAGIIRKLTQAPWIAWPKTRAYVPFGTTYASLYVNLSGRERQGYVTEPEYESLRNELIDHLPTLIDPSTGQPVIVQVYKREEIFSGPALPELPDLMIRPQDGYLLETRFKGNRIFDPLPAYLSGLHRMEGMYVLTGEAFNNCRCLDQVHLIDLAPTILHLLDVSVPEWMDGRPLTDEPVSFVPERQFSDQDKFFSNTEFKPAEGKSIYSSEEKTQVVDRLHDLGYL
jgi:predicted AlkP superfamily phosphohydrolase/phosphomutase